MSEVSVFLSTRDYVYLSCGKSEIKIARSMTGPGFADLPRLVGNPAEPGISRKG